MGSRAVITTSQAEEIENSQDTGFYTQSFGPRNCIEAFLVYCKMSQIPSPEKNISGWDGLYMVMKNFSGDNARIRIGECCDLDIELLDYGVYIIRDWEIIDRQFQFAADEVDYDRVYDMILKIDQAQPKGRQLGKAKIDKLWETLNPEYKLYMKLAEKYNCRKRSANKKKDIER